MVAIVLKVKQHLILSSILMHFLISLSHMKSAKVCASHTDYPIKLNQK